MKRLCCAWLVMGAVVIGAGRIARAQVSGDGVAERTFQRQSIHFAREYELAGEGASWIAYRGEIDREMSAADFYAAVGRPDLLRSYESRRRTGTVISAVSDGVILVGLGITVSRMFHACPANDPQLERCSVDDLETTLIGVGVLAVGLAGAGLGHSYLAHAHPIDASDARQLADAYNRRLRDRLGLPAVRRDPVLRDLQIAPRIRGSDGGLVLGGRF